ncbi:MAG: hypothetical protein R3F44_00360 [Candidatus Competibacteraceae bacterium]
MHNATPHIVTKWGCWNTYFVNPKQDTMAHGFLFQDEGAAAVLGATALTDLNLLRGFGNAFFGQFGRRATLGEALRKVQQRHVSANPGAARAHAASPCSAIPPLKLRVADDGPVSSDAHKLTGPTLYIKPAYSELVWLLEKFGADQRHGHHGITSSLLRCDSGDCGPGPPSGSFTNNGHGRSLLCQRS